MMPQICFMPWMQSLPGATVAEHADVNPLYTSIQPSIKLLCIILEATVIHNKAPLVHHKVVYSDWRARAWYIVELEHDSYKPYKA